MEYCLRKMEYIRIVKLRYFEFIAPNTCGAGRICLARLLFLRSLARRQHSAAAGELVQCGGSHWAKKVQ